jgi:inward rectifier potassium channel
VVEPQPAPTSAEAPRDLGFGGALSRSGRVRLLRRDGTFTPRRVGLGFVESFGLYHYLLTTNWTHFLFWVSCGFVAVNALFAVAFVSLGPGALQGATAESAGGRFFEAFFFSIHTFTTIGYGNIVPRSVGANVVDAVEALVGLIGAAILAGMVFARVSRPRAGVVFSDWAVVAPYQGRAGLMFRLANTRRNELIQVNVVVNLSLLRPDGTRAFSQLPLERASVDFMPTSWTVVHPIDETSPIFGLGREQLTERAPELFALLTATEEVFSQAVHTRISYAGPEIVWGAKFANILSYDEAGTVTSVDVSRLSDIEPAPLPS